MAKNDKKVINLNNSMQYSQKLFDSNLILTDYNIYKENLKENKKDKIKIKLNKCYNKNKLNKSNITENKNSKIIINPIKIQKKMPPKNVFSEYEMKAADLTRNNNSIKKQSTNAPNKKMTYKDKNLNHSMNVRVSPYSSNMNDFKNSTIKKKKFEIKERNSAKKRNIRIHRNLNFTLTDYLSVEGAVGKINIINNKSPEIIIKRNIINNTKKKFNKRVNLSKNSHNYNNTHLNISNNNINNKSKLSNKNNSINYPSLSTAKRRTKNKVNIFPTSSKESSIVKNIDIYSNKNKLEYIKKNLNEQINNINSNYRNISYISDKDIMLKNQLIFDVIQNSFFNFISLLENSKEREIAFDIIQKLSDFFKNQDKFINDILSKNNESNEKIKKYKEINKNLEKDNMILMDKCENYEKKQNEIENKLKSTSKNFSNNIYQINTFQEYFYNNNSKPNNKEDKGEEVEDSSSVNTEELESIRFFDKIVMKKHSFSKANIPELEINQIKKINEESSKEEIKIKIDNNNIKNKNNKNIKPKFQRNQNKENNLGLHNNWIKSHKSMGYTKIAKDKKKVSGEKIWKFK